MFDIQAEPGTRWVVSTFGSTRGRRDGGPTEAQFYTPSSIEYNRFDNCFYITDSNRALRKLDMDGITSTAPFQVYKTATSETSATTAPLASTISAATVAYQYIRSHRGYDIDQRNGDMYVSEWFGSKIRKISLPGRVTYRFIPKEAVVERQKAISLQSLGNLPLSIWASIISLCDFGSLRRMTQVCFAFYCPSKECMGVHVSTVAGGVQGMADGRWENAMFYHPRGVCFSERDECLYVADEHNNRIRKINTITGVVSTVAGGELGFVDGPGTTARFFHPLDVKLADGDTSLLVADGGNNCIRHIKLEGQAIVSTIAGCGVRGDEEDGDALKCRFNQPTSLCVDHRNNACYFTDYGNNKIRKLSLLRDDHQ